MLTTILATVIVLGVLIFVHELGHFVAAKAVGIEVERFSIGFGPRILGFRRGETEYVISLLPLGGYVKMAGMEELEPIEGKSVEPGTWPDATSTGSHASGAAALDGAAGADGDRRINPRGFDAKSIPARVLVLSAGVLMNIIFAIVVFAVSALSWGVPVEPEARIPASAATYLPADAAALAEVPAGTRITAVGKTRIDDWGDLRTALLTATPGPLIVHLEEHAPVTIQVPASDTLRIALISALEPGHEPAIGQVMAGSPAAQAGIEAGDVITSIAGEPIASWPQLVAAIEARPGESVAIEVERDGQPVVVQVVPRAEIVATADGGERVVGRIGIGQAADVIPRASVGAGTALVHGVEQTWGYAKMVVKLLGDLVTGKVSARSLGGPILVGQMSGQMVRVGLEAFLSFMAFFSVNLAVLNLLPIPVLDGGHLALLGVEAVRGRALSLEVRARVMQVGFVIVLAIMAWAVGNDILRLFGL